MGEFDQTIGFTLMGVTINTYLTGVIMSQFFTYWNSKFNDALWLKSMVAFLFIINITQAAAVVYMSWNFTNPSVVAMSLPQRPQTLIKASSVTAVLALINQMFQAWRIYVFTQNKILVGSLVVAALVTCGMGITAAIQSWILHQLAKLIVLQPVVEANLTLQCAIDVIIATVSFSRSKTSFRRTDKVFNRLIRTAVQSGFFTVRAYRTQTMMDSLITREELRNLLTGHSPWLMNP
ncbi:hypothetical protein FB451DRAFT_1180074 [Mycena latifolia]|nr:hypothetical protein FB451DRAFT_1180074 [Mycena latifolia]